MRPCRPSISEKNEGSTIISVASKCMPCPCISSGSVFLTSDDIGSWSDDMLERFQMALRLLLERKGLV